MKAALVILGAGGLITCLAWLGLQIIDAEPGEPVVVLEHGRPKPQGGFYTMALPEPAGVNPYTTSGAVARQIVLRHTHDTLLEFTPADGSLRPCLAVRHESSEGGRKLVFTLRTDARFSDGAPVTMDDVLFAWELRKAGVPLGSTLGGALDGVESMRASGPTTLEVRFGQVTFASLASFSTDYLVAEKRWFLDAIAKRAREQGRSAPRPGDPEFARRLESIDEPGPGSGPFRFFRWRRGRDLYLTQNPESWRRKERPDDWNLAGLHVRFVQDPAACFALARQGKLDLYLDPDARAVLANNPEMARTHRALTYDHRGNGHYIVAWNHRRKPLDDPRVRTALTMLFDREAIVRTAFAGAATPSRTWFRPGSADDTPPGPPVPFDVKGARRLLAEAGAADLSVEILFASSQPVQKRILDIAVPAFRDAGVTLRATPVEFGTLQSRLQEHDFDGELLHASLRAFVDPYLHFHSSQIGSGQNWMGFRDARADELLAGARVELDPAKRAALFREFNAIFQALQPVTLLAHPLSSVLLSRRFEGVELGVLGLTPEKWWVETK